MNEFQKRKKVKEFVDFWKKHSKIEKQDDQTFWNMFLRDVLDINEPERIIKYQAETDSNKTNWIDAWIKSTGVIIEQKSSGVDLLKPAKQSDGTYKDAFEQAKNYDNNMNKYNKSNWIVTCNFDKFLIYDMNNIKRKYLEVNLEDLPSCYDNFRFMVDKNAVLHDMEVSVSKEAGKIIGNIYDEIERTLKEYNMNTPERLKDLNAFCVRLVFCCFAEDSGLFVKGQFRDFIEKTDVNHLQSDLLSLFDVLNQQERNPFLREDLRSFPYVNGELFAEKIDIPPLNENVKKYILEDACDGFDWSKINPTIFGAIFESTLNPETRRSSGMHYTSIENIHKVIDPLFLDDLKGEFSDIRKSSQVNKKLERLEELQDKISKLTFLDPACGSGNFLTETYLELRRLENNIIREKININKGQTALFYGKDNELIRVHIQQFFGIEINDFAVAVSKTALWIAEYQMWLETKDLDYNNRLHDFLPLDSYENIIESNALTYDWEKLVSHNKLSYIIGNPPFVGSSRTDEKNSQKVDMDSLFSDIQGAGKLDYVAGWYMKSAKYMQGTNIKGALVSTNSITQGEQVSLLWKTLFDKYNIEIIFAHRSFKWSSESTKSAAVVCVIIGFAIKGKALKKYLFNDKDRTEVSYINGYLSEQDDFYIKSRKKLDNNKIPKIVQGNKPWDGKNLLLSTDEKEVLLNKYPQLNGVIKRFYGGKELIDNKYRYCLWLKDVNPSIYYSIPEIMERLKKVTEERMKTKTSAVKNQAKTPMLFSQIRQPDSDFLAIPEVSTDAREYIPMAYLTKDDITSNKIFMVVDCPIYIFSILISNVHMAWMRTVAGRLGTGYSYSPSVYNNFPWIDLSEVQKESLIQSGKKILDIRNNYDGASLATLYDSNTMPPDLRKAHYDNDKLVMKLYGINNKADEKQIVQELMKIYNEKDDLQ